jgi:hypothetical protein
MYFQLLDSKFSWVTQLVCTMALETYAGDSLAAVRASQIGHVLSGVPKRHALVTQAGGWGWSSHLLYVKTQSSQNPGNGTAMTWNQTEGP